MDEFYRRPLPEYIVAHDDPLVRQLSAWVSPSRPSTAAMTR